MQARCGRGWAQSTAAGVSHGGLWTGAEDGIHQFIASNERVVRLRPVVAAGTGSEAAMGKIVRERTNREKGPQVHKKEE